LKDFQAKKYAKLVLAVKIGDNLYPNLIEDQADSETENQYACCTERYFVLREESIFCREEKGLQKSCSF
jgi:hypothetical protein